MSDILKRPGTFVIATRLLQDRPDDILNLLSKVIVVRCECVYMNNELHYMGYSELFDKIDGSHVVPEYEIVMTNEGNVEAVRR